MPKTAHNRSDVAAVPSAWAHTATELYELLKTSEQGLSEDEAARRLKRLGPNEFRKHRNTGTLTLLLEQFSSPLIFMLIAAAVITVILREWVETAVIVLAVVVNAALGFYQEYKAENTLEKLTVYIKERTRVMRDGQLREIASSEIVPGDVIHLSLGARVPADARLISLNNLHADEAVLTGESLPTRKIIEVVAGETALTERDNMVFAGSLIAEGYASALVVETGEHTEIGRIAQLVSEVRREQTPLQHSLSTLAWIIFAGVAVIVAGLFFLGISRGEPILEMLLLSVATAVGAVPEALPIVLTVILAVGVERIASRKGIVRSLSAAETLGSTTLVMTDKTGTLTQATMRVTGVLTGKHMCTGDVHAPMDLAELSAAQKTILSTALLATDAVVENATESQKDWRYVGRPLETNIAAAAQGAGIDVLSITQERRMPILPFNSTNKFAVTFDRQAKVYSMLGAPDILLARSTVSKDEYITIEACIQNMSGAGGRVVGVARSAHTSDREISPSEAAELHRLEFLGVIVLYDPVRREAKEAMRRIRSHGASVVMLTGDLKGTALSIASDIGWKVGQAEIMTGEEIRTLSDIALARQLPLTKIFARVTPEDKLRIGRLYQARGEIVAMTGDGVNDAPALKAADIGIALGSGSDVAKSAADLVLLDDNFMTIVLAIEEGRRIISNIRKTFVYLMSNCLDEVFLIGGSLIFALPLPLTAIQIIWVNFFTGGLPAMAYAFEENRDVGLTRKEHMTIFNTQVRVLTVGIGVATSALLFVFYWALLAMGTPLDVARTVLFLCFGSYILVIAFCFKSLHHSIFAYPLFDNRALNVSVFFAGALLVCSMIVPLLRETLGLVMISVSWFAVVVAWLVFNVILVEATKWFFRRMGRRGKNSRAKNAGLL